MGKITGFMEINRETPFAASGRRTPEGLARIRSQDARGQAARAGRPLHGLRNPLLPQGLSARQHHSRLERSHLPRQVARGDRPPARDQQLSGIHRQDLSGPVRRSLRAQHQQRSRHDQADREEHHRSRVGGKMDRAAAACAQIGKDASQSSARDRRGWHARSNSLAPDMLLRFTSARIASADCSLTASPTSSWKSGSSIGASSR